MRKYHIHIMLIVIGSLLYFFAHFQRIAIPAPIFDVLQNELNLSANKITVFSAIFMYSYALGTLFSGLLIDKFGGIKVFMFGALIFSAGSILFANANYLPLMYLARSLVGIGASTFYLSLVSEAKKCFLDKYFGIALAFILFIGYLGGIVANAPFTICVTKFGVWKSLNFAGIFTLGITFIYIICQHLLKSHHSSSNIQFSLQPYKEIFLNRNNYCLFAFYTLCTGMHYTILTVIGAKFLTDYMAYSPTKSAFILSILVIIASFAGLLLSSICKITGNKRIPFVKFLAYMSFTIFLIISICIMLNIKTIFIPVLILILALNGGNVPITVPVAMNTNHAGIRSTTLSVMNSLAFVMVGVFATIIGHILDLFPIAGRINNYNIYSNKAYLTVFILFTILAFVEVLSSHKIKETL